MLAQIWAVMAPVLTVAGVGYFWGRAGRPFDTRMVSALITSVCTPCLIVATLGKAPLDMTTLLQVMALFVAVITVTGLVAITVIKLTGKSPRVFLASLMFPNTGNMGLSLCLLAFGHEGLALALSWMMLTSVVQFSLGLAVVSGEGLSRRLLGHPILISVVIAVAMVAFQVRLPEWLFNSVNLVGQITIPMMLITLGVSLSQLKVHHLGPGAGFAVLRLLLGFATAWAVCALTGIDGVLRGVVMIQSSMPVAVFNYLLAQSYRQGPDQVAAMVVFSTVLSFLTLPFLLLFVGVGG